MRQCRGRQQPLRRAASSPLRDARPSQLRRLPCLLRPLPQYGEVVDVHLVRDKKTGAPFLWLARAAVSKAPLTPPAACRRAATAGLWGPLGWGLRPTVPC